MKHKLLGKNPLTLNDIKAFGRENAGIKFYDKAEQRIKNPEILLIKW